MRLPSGRRFEATEGESILGAALRSGLVLEHSCRTGRCSSCQAQVVSGATVSLNDELGLTASAREQGWILSCVRSATTDVELSGIADLTGLGLPTAKTWPCRIASIEPLASGVLRVELRLPPSGQFEYRAGQYIELIAPSGFRRSYSLAGAPVAKGTLELHVRKVPGGAMSDYLFGQAKPGDLLRLNGPLGTFVLRQAVPDLAFLATGTGMAPVKGMLESIRSQAAGARPRTITVYWGGRLPDDLYWDPLTLGVELRYVPVLSRAGTGWPGARGYVQEALLADRHDLREVEVYAAGSEEMVRSAREALLAAGLPAHQYFSDAFACTAPAAATKETRP